MGAIVPKEFKQSDRPVASGPPQESTDQIQLVEPDSEVRKLLKDRQTSSLQKYMWLTTGKTSLLQLAYFETVMFFLAGMRGALGIFLRQKFYRSLFKECGRGVVFGRNITIRHPHRIRIGDGVILDENVVLDGKGEADTTISIGDKVIVGRNSSLVCKGGRIEVATRANISLNCTIISETFVAIGDSTLLGGHCYIIAGGNHGIEFNGVNFVDQPRTQKGGVEILSNCWIGANATILDGTRIGPDAVVGAASLVNRDVASRTIVGGVPAQPISRDQSKVKMPRIAH